MLLDKQLMFSEDQAITAAADSTNVIDLSSVRDVGRGEELYIALTVTETFADSGSDSTLTVELQTDDNAAMSSEAIVQSLVTLAALTAAGTQLFFRLPNEALVAYQRYLALKFTPNNGNLSAGKITAGIVKSIQKSVAYPSGFSIS